MKYNDNGTYKDIYVKTFDTLPVGTEVDYDGSVVPDGWTEVDEVETGTITITNTSQVSGTLNYVKYGRLVQILFDLKIISGTSSTWTTINIASLPDNLKPLAYTVTETTKDTAKGSNYNIVGIYVSATSQALGFSDRGRGNLSTDNNNAYVGTITYISAE